MSSKGWRPRWRSSAHWLNGVQGRSHRYVRLALATGCDCVYHPFELSILYCRTCTLKSVHFLILSNLGWRHVTQCSPSHYYLLSIQSAYVLLLAVLLQLCLSFYERRRKQAWFGTKDERMYWEQWCVLPAGLGRGGSETGCKAGMLSTRLAAGTSSHSAKDERIYWEQCSVTNWDQGTG